MKGLARVAVLEGDAARSGAIGDDEETWMQTVVSGRHRAVLLEGVL